MNLKSRLSRLRTQAGSGIASRARKPTVSDLRARIVQLEKRRPGKKGLAPAGARKTPSDTGAPSGINQPSGAIDRGQRAAGKDVEHCPGTILGMLEGEPIGDGLIRIRKRLPLTGMLGSIALHSLRNRPRLPGEAENENRRHVYIDTETTGLSGGSGTLAFLIGIAMVEDDAIMLSQFLMTRFAAETGLLSAFADTLSDDDRLVSYNGKSYDLPLLISRFRMQSLQHPFDGLPHLDLLHPVRRLFRRRWHDCRLTSLEQNLLGFSRIDDLPGSEAPAAWFSYIRSGQGDPLVKVVEHNRQDIISLAVAHSALTQAIAQPQMFDADLHALARWLSESNEDSARELLVSHEDKLCDDGRRLLARLARRAGYWPQAVALWETLAAAGCSDSLERLAKYHEHVSNDLTAAWRYCNMLPGNPDQQQRRRRIERKIHRIRQEQGVTTGRRCEGC
jgi:uncharacterized protein YprB with RNaseH-like and TPR domain